MRQVIQAADHIGRSYSRRSTYMDAKIWAFIYSVCMNPFVLRIIEDHLMNTRGKTP